MTDNNNINNNIIDKIKQKLNFSFTSNWIIEILSYLAVGFIVGFIVKHVSKHIITFIIISLLSLLFLEYIGVATINYSYLHQLFGLPPETSISDILNQIISWMQNNIAQCIAIALGFYLSLELT